MEAESALNPLSFFFIRKGGSRSGTPYVHGVWVTIVEGVPPLEFGRASSLFASLDPFLQVNVLLLMMSCCSSPVIPGYWVIEFYAVCYQFVR